MRTVLHLAVVLCGSIAGAVLAADPNTLTDGEKKAGFELLFNGNNLHGWEPALGSSKLEDGPWKVQDGAIYFPPCLGHPSLAYHRNAIPPDFELRFEWKESPSSKPYLQGHYAIGTHGSMKQDRWTGNLFCDYYAGDRGIQLVTQKIDIPVKFAGISQCLAPCKDVKRPAGQWNKSRMICKGSLVQHWLNGEKIIDIDLRQGDWLKLKTEKGNPLLDKWFQVKKQGFRLEIQDSDVPGWYRGLKVRAIPKEETACREKNKSGGEWGFGEGVEPPHGPLVVVAQFSGLHDSTNSGGIIVEGLLKQRIVSIVCGSRGANVYVGEKRATEARKIIRSLIEEHSLDAVLIEASGE